MADRSLGPLLLVASIFGAIFFLPRILRSGGNGNGGGEEPVIAGTLQGTWTPTVS